jgi:S-formylglutathione hydrolase FrmB
MGLFLLGCYAEGNAVEANPSRDAATVQWVTPAVDAPRLQYRTFLSAAAKSRVSFHIYTPEFYDSDKSRRFPVLYWLHGHGGGLPGIPHLVKHFDAAIRAGKIPPMLVVFLNGMEESMWCDSKDGSVPMETVVVKELIPHVDATFRTIASRAARMIEGFSMGGYGSARLGFKYHDIFGAVSIQGAGPLQREFSPSIGPPEMTSSRARALRTVYDSNQKYFMAQSPWLLADQNAAVLREKTRVRQIIGDRDPTLNFNRDFDEHLTRLAITHSFIVLSDVGHSAPAIFNALGESNWEFYRAVFGVKDSESP